MRPIFFNMRGKTNENIAAQTVGSVSCIDRVAKGW